MAQEGRDPGGDAPGGWGRAEPAGASRRGRTGGGRRRQSQVGGRRPSRKLAVQPPPWNSGPPQVLASLDPSPGSQVSPATPLRGLTRLLIETAGRSSFPSSSALGRAASNPSRGGGRVAQAAALRQRNPTSIPAAASSFLPTQPAGCPALCALLPLEGGPKVSRSRVEKNRDPGAPSWSPALGRWEGGPRSQGTVEGR